MIRISYYCILIIIKVAVMDIDICGPSAPRILGVEGETGK
jgi:hypothetical protein